MDNIEITYQLSEIQAAAKKFLTTTQGYKVFTFSGELGAGKTTFISALCREMGINEIVSSPTFSIIQQYDSPEGQAVYHMDLYRIKSGEEAIRAGIEDCLLSGEICLVEWPENAPEIFPDILVKSAITILDNNQRKLLISFAE